jgi:hypothetical protein
MQLQIRYPAGPHQRFAPTAFDRGIGQTIQLEPGLGAGRLVAAEVIEDGAEALLTIEVDGDELARLLEATIAARLRWGAE